MMTPAAGIYRRLTAPPSGRDPLDRHLFAAMLAAGLAQKPRSLCDFLGLDPMAIRLMLAAYFPFSGIDAPRSAGIRDEAVEEEDFRLLLLAHRSRGVIEEEWLAAIIARRSQEANHLWEDLGLFSRDDLNGLMSRHFTRLYRRNDKNMRWKKFFYRTMCESEGLRLCKSPNCESCPDLRSCFESESVLLRPAC